MFCPQWIRIALFLGLVVAPSQAARRYARALNATSTSISTSTSTSTRASIIISSTTLHSSTATSSARLQPSTSSTITPSVNRTTTSTVSPSVNRTTTSTVAPSVNRTTTSTITPSVNRTTTTAKSTSCAPGPFDPFQFGNAVLYSLPPEQADAIRSLLTAKYLELYRQVAAVNAMPPDDSAALCTYVNDIYDDLQGDLNYYIGPQGYAYLQLSGVSDSCVLDTCLNQFASKSASFVPKDSCDLFFYTADPPCCQQCTLQVQAVELLYWPTPAPQPPVTALVNQGGYTINSPTVIAVFEGVTAANRCGQVGAAYDFIALPFGPTALSTSSIPVNPSTSIVTALQGNFTVINYADFGSGKCTCTTNCSTNQLGQVQTDLCTPQLSFPSELQTFDPLWATCVPNTFGGFDPPVALPEVAGLSVPKSNPATPTPDSQGPSPAPVSTAVPANSPTPPNVGPTAQPVTVPVVGPTAILSPASQAPANQAPANQPASQAPANQPASQAPANQPLASQVPANQPPASQVPASQALASPGPGPVLSSVAGISGGATLVGGAAPPFTPASILTINGVIVTANSQSAFVVGTQTLVPGGPAITVSGTVISLASGGAVVVGTQTIVPGGPAITVSGIVIPLASGGAVVVGTQTIVPGGPAITVSGTVISIAPGGAIVVGTQTLAPGGPAITVSGTVISLAPGGTQLVVGGTSTLAVGVGVSVASSTRTGTGTATGTQAPPSQFTGSASEVAGFVLAKAVAVVVLTGFMLS